MRTHRRTLLLLGVYLSLTGHFLISDAVTLLLQRSECDAGRGLDFRRAERSRLKSCVYEGRSGYSLNKIPV